jgi:hypothetical protein
MKLPPLVFVLGFAGLVPCFVDPVWLLLSPVSAPAWLDAAWLTYLALVAAFMAGTFWGFSAPAAQGRDGMIGLLIASAQVLATWVSLLLPFKVAIVALAVVFAVQLAAEIWRERALDTIPGYFKLRVQLSVGVVAALLLRFVLS